jgi:hypothetical protein
MQTGAIASFLATLAGVACSHREPSTVPSPSQPSTASTGLDCALEARRGDPAWSLAFVLSNRTPQPKVIHYHRPFLQFTLRVIGDGQDLRIVQGDFDGPAQPAELVVPAGGTATLTTPVTLQFTIRADLAADAFAWMVIGEPRKIEIRAMLRLENEAVPECVAHIDRS